MRLSKQKNSGPQKNSISSLFTTFALISLVLSLGCSAGALIVQSPTPTPTPAPTYDLNISKALAAVADFVRAVNSSVDEGNIGAADALAVLDFMRRIDSVLGVFTFERAMLPEEIEDLIEERRRAREWKDYGRADEIRDILKSKGIVIEDTKEGARWKRLR